MRAQPDAVRIGVLEARAERAFGQLAPLSLQFVNSADSETTQDLTAQQRRADPER